MKKSLVIIFVLFFIVCFAGTEIRFVEARSRNPELTASAAAPAPVPASYDGDIVVYPCTGCKHNRTHPTCCDCDIRVQPPVCRVCC